MSAWKKNKNKKQNISRLLFHLRAVWRARVEVFSLQLHSAGRLALLRRQLKLFGRIAYMDPSTYMRQFVSDTSDRFGKAIPKFTRRPGRPRACWVNEVYNIAAGSHDSGNDFRSLLLQLGSSIQLWRHAIDHYSSNQHID